MGAQFSSATRGDDGLYTVSVLQNGKALPMQGKYIRFDTTGATLPEKEFKMTGKELKPDEKLPQLAEMVRSQMLTKMALSAIFENEEGKKNAVRAVYVPVDIIRKTSKGGVDKDRSKTVLALLYSMFMSEKDIYNRLVQVSTKPGGFDNDSEMFDLVTSALYTPEFRLPYDVPNGVVDGVTGDNRDLLRALYSPQEIPSKPVVPSSGSANLLLILLALVVVVAIVYFLMRK